MINILKKVDRIATKMERAMMISTGLLLILITLIAVIDRYIFKTGLMTWYPEVIIILYTLMIMWGASNLAKDGELMQVNLLDTKLSSLSASVCNKYRLLNSILCLVISVMGTYYWWMYSVLTKSDTPILKIPNTYIFLIAFFLGFLGLSVRYLMRIVNLLRD